MNRRKFMKETIAAGVGASLLSSAKLLRGQEKTAEKKKIAAGPMVMASSNGERAVRKAMEIILAGGGVLDAVIAGVNINEDDPNDMSVGFGGLPNEDGVVQLDASVMYGPTHACGAVAALENIKNPSKVARLVMERSDHCLLAGAGALKFAKAHGFTEENLLTDRAREEWLKWRESLSDKDNWLSLPENKKTAAIRRFLTTWGTINCCALDADANLAGVTTTSGLSYKLSGRVGDSPVIGAGLYVDNQAGAAGSTGRGEANIANLSSFFIVERMKAGASPTDACLDACRQIVSHNLLPRHRNSRGLPDFNVSFYALSKSGQAGGAAIYGGGWMWIGDAQGVRRLELPGLYRPEWLKS